MRRKTLVLVAVFAGFLATSGMAQTVDTGGVKIKLIGRVQTQFSTTSIDETELLDAGRVPSVAIPASTFETRRIRFGAELDYRGWVTGKLETEVGMARLQVRDAYMNLAFDQRFQFRVGQFKKPFSLLQLYSSATWPVIERSVRIRGLSDILTYHDSVAGGTRVLQNFRGLTVIGEEQDLLDNFLYQNFDMGASVHGRFGPVTYAAGVFNGAGWDRLDDGNAKSYAGRVTYKAPIALPLTVGAGASHRELRITNRPAIVEAAGTAYEIDLEVGAFRRPGPHFLGEAVIGDNLQDDTKKFVGAQGMLSWFMPTAGTRVEGFELAGRVSYGDPRREIDADEGLLLTPGINIYFNGRNRLMLNWDFFMVSDRFSDENALRAQAQFAF